jgi:hypothetical protein
LKVPPSLPSPPARADYLIGFELHFKHLNLDIKCSDIQELVLSKQGPLELAHFSSPPGSMLMKDVENYSIQLSAFLLRKCDMGIFTLMKDGRTKNRFDYESWDTLLHSITLWGTVEIPGTGQESGMFRACHIDVNVLTCAPVLYNGDHTGVAEVNFAMAGNKDSFEETHVESVEGLLQIIESPAFAKRWVLPPALQITSLRPTPHAKPVCRSAPGGAGRRAFSSTRITDVQTAALNLIAVLNVKLLAAVIINLGGKDLRRASEVSRHWFTAAMDEDSWMTRCDMKFSCLLPYEPSRSLWSPKSRCRCHVGPGNSCGRCIRMGPCSGCSGTCRCLSVGVRYSMPCVLMLDLTMFVSQEADLPAASPRGQKLHRHFAAAVGP